MKITTCVIFSLCMSVLPAPFAVASTEDISNVIERFVENRFPDAHSHFWVVNSTEWGSKDEVVVDVNTTVRNRRDEGPTENRFLLLIVGGKLEAMQSIPLDATVECQPDDIV